MKYISKCHNLVLTMKPHRMQLVEGIAYPVPGEHARFSSNEFETDDKKIIEWMSKHRLNGTAFTQTQIEVELAVAK